jgi:hypothetical protein
MHFHVQATVASQPHGHAAAKLPDKGQVASIDAGPANLLP